VDEISELSYSLGGMKRRMKNWGSGSSENHFRLDHLNIWARSAWLLRFFSCGTIEKEVRRKKTEK
jgi:hypothetical protein